MRIVTPDDATEIHGSPDRAPAAHGEVRFTPGAVVANRYRIVALIGGGGMGEVYRADDLKLRQRVALKYVPLRDAMSLDRLFNEVRVGRQITHPNVCRLHDVVEVDGHHFITMEFVDGEDLASLLRRIGRLPADKALALTRDICAGLAAAHDRGFVHRDLKPANIMIDGRGSARITDFGLTALAGEGTREFAGTPAYMAPEQLDARGATIRSDIYALGLVLFEMYTGRRVFDAQSVTELRAQHALTKTRPASLVRELDPAVERVILRCLEEDPAARPASVQEILAALPGGDPLQAAVAAGETPSPEMVAAASRSGELPAARAWTLLAITLLLIALMVPGRFRKSILGHVGEVKSPVALDDRARSIIEELGWERGAHSAGFFISNRANIAEALKKGRALGPGDVPYLYRDAPAPIVPANPYGWVRRTDPAMVVPGMTAVLLDARGSLRELRRVPPERIAERAATTDWSVPFRAAGLDLRQFRDTAPRLNAPVGSDARRAWVRESDGLRVEAATAAGLPVWFIVAEQSTSPMTDPSTILTITNLLAFVLMAVLVVALFVARRNVVRGRADLRGAQRIALFAMLAELAASLLIARHNALPAEEWVMITHLIAYALYYGLVSWVCYLAVEPYVRRQWPSMLVGWTRLVAGRFRDPLVGTELLIGLLAGAAGTAANVYGVLLLARFTPVAPYNPLFWPSIRAPLGAGHAVLHASATALTYTLGVVTMLVLTRRLLRNDRAAWIVSGVVIGAAAADAPPWAVIESVTTTVAVLVAIRLGGILAGTTAFALYYISSWTPFTWDPQAWYFGRTVFALLVLSAAAVYAFRVSLGNRPALAFQPLAD
ncbi:MAG TPA: serine/threonine-protein kinase [Thermoanaerobaculia bacterium]|jgi:serine/threonine-protein kinase